MNPVRKLYSVLRDFVFSPPAARLTGEPFFFIKGMRKGGPLETKDLRRVLVVKLDEIGDAVMLTPFTRELRAGLPQAWITLVVKPQLKELWEPCPYIDQLVTYDRQTGPSNLYNHNSALSLARTIFWKKRYDLAIVPRWDTDYYNASFLAYFSGAPMRLGYRQGGRQTIEYDYDALYTSLLDGGIASRHEVEKNLELLKLLKWDACNNKLELWLDERDTAFADTAFKKRSGLNIAFGIGAASDKRIWPLEYFKELANRLTGEMGATIIVLGGEKERATGEKLVSALGDTVISLAGRTTLRQAAAVLKKAAIYVGNDSGLMHIAAAVGIPVVEISCHPSNGSTDHYNSPSRFGPWGVPKAILQPERAIAPCTDACVAEHAHCIEKVSVNTVQKAVKDLLKQLPSHDNFC